MRPDYRNLYRFAGRVRAPGSLMPSVYTLSAFQALIAQALPLTLANTSSGNRDSAFVDGDARATNVTPSLASLFDDIGANVTITPLGAGVERVQMPNMASTYFKQTGLTIGASSHTIAFDWRNHPSSTESGTLQIASQDAGVDNIVYANSTPPTEWAEVVVTKTEDGDSDQFAFYDIGGVDIEIRNIRFVNSSAPVPPFVAGTGAGETCAVDLLSATPSWPSAGTAVQAVMPYGYSGANNPVNAAARLFYATAYSVLNPGNITVNPGLDTNVSVTDGAIDVISSDWSGSTVGARGNDQARITASSALVPTGVLYIGNTSTGIRPFHGALATLIFPWVLSDAEYEIVRVGLNSLFSGVTFQ